MWSLARCLAHRANGSPRAGARLEARFLKPLLLPGDVRLHVATPEVSGSRGFWLVSARDGTPHLKGTWHPGAD